jgi:hypothetical protein
LPGAAPEVWRDETAMKAFAAKYKDSPTAFVVYSPTANPAMGTMLPTLAKQFVSDVLVSLLAAWIMSLGMFGFAKRILIGVAIGLAAWLSISVPYWNWYLFPLESTLGALLDSSLGLMLASVPMAWWLGRSR